MCGYYQDSDLNNEIRSFRRQFENAIVDFNNKRRRVGRLRPQVTIPPIRPTAATSGHSFAFGIYCCYQKLFKFIFKYSGLDITIL